MFGKLKGIFQQEVCVLFVCPVTKKPVKSGPNGLGYRLKVTKEWVKKAAPVLIITLRIAQLAMNAYGIPFPLPALPLDMLQTEFLDSVLQNIDSEFKSFTAQLTEEDEEQVEAYNDIMNVLNIAEDDGT